MIQYNPQTQDMRGQYLMHAAETDAQAKVQLVNDIGGALVSLAGAYGQMQGTKAKGKNFKKFMGMAGETFGMDGSMFGDMEDYDAGLMLDSFGSWMPAMANAQLGKQRMEQAPIVQTQRDITRNNINNANTRAEEGDYFDATSLR
jgi:hypothetical protein